VPCTGIVCTEVDVAGLCFHYKAIMRGVVQHTGSFENYLDGRYFERHILKVRDKDTVISFPKIQDL